MRIIFVSKYPFERSQDGSVTSAGASARLRILEPAVFLSTRGHKVNLVTIQPEARDPQIEVDGDVVVVSKVIEPLALKRLAEVAERGVVPFVTDICDNRLNHPVFGPPLRRLAAASRRVFCNTDVMAEVIRSAVPGVPVDVLHEPVEGEPLPRKPLPTGVVRLLWFGHQDGLPQLQRDYAALCELARERAFSLQIVCGVTPEVLRWVAITNDSAISTIPVSLVPWSPRALREACRVADIAVLPGSDDEFWRTKSPNRLVQALWYGLRVAAFAFPSYLAYEQYSNLDRDITAAVRKALECDRGADVLGEIGWRHSRESVGEAWERTLSML